MNKLVERICLIGILCLMVLSFSACDKDTGDDKNPKSLSEIYYLDDIPYNLVGTAFNETQLISLMQQKGCSIVVNTVTEIENLNSVLVATGGITFTNETKDYGIGIIVGGMTLNSNVSKIICVTYAPQDFEGISNEKIDQYLENYFGKKLNVIPSTDYMSEIFRKKCTISNSVELFVHNNNALYFEIPGLN